MSANHAKDFDTRKASAEETARWLRPNLQRAKDMGEREISIPLKDLDELLAYVEAVEHRVKAEYAGKHLGYADPEMMRQLLSRKRASVPVLFKKTKQYCVPIGFVELPPRDQQKA